MLRINFLTTNDSGRRPKLTTRFIFRRPQLSITRTNSKVARVDHTLARRPGRCARLIRFHPCRPGTVSNDCSIQLRRRFEGQHKLPFSPFKVPPLLASLPPVFVTNPSSRNLFILESQKGRRLIPLRQIPDLLNECPATFPITKQMSASTVPRLLIEAPAPTSFDREPGGKSKRAVIRADASRNDFNLDAYTFSRSDQRSKFYRDSRRYDVTE
jgi:hypothetical protein